MRRRPRLKNEVRLRATFFGGVPCVFFFDRQGRVLRRPPTGRDGPVECERHDEDQAVHTVDTLELAVFQSEAPALEVREHRFVAKHASGMTMPQRRP